MKRRHFLAAASATGLVALLRDVMRPVAGQAVSQSAGSSTSLAILKPSPLQPGDQVGILSPAGAVFLQNELDIVVDAVRGLGLVPKLAPHVLDRYGYLAGTDRDRASDMNQFFADPEIKALLPVTGGWGSSRTLPYLDYEVIRQNPKILIGFSDLTALLLGIHAQTGLVTFHGPNGLTSWRSDQTASFRQVLFEGGMTSLTSERPPDDSDRLMQVQNRIQVITPGRAQGRLIGGNLSVLSGIVGSPYVPNLDGAVLFLEDVGEDIYRLDRMITQLKLAGVFDNLAGFIFGQCTNCGPDADYGSLTLEQVLRDHIQPLGIPAWQGAAIGHVEPVLTLPIGTQVEINTSNGSLRMLEPAVQVE